MLVGNRLILPFQGFLKEIVGYISQSQIEGFILRFLSR